MSDFVKILTISGYVLPLVNTIVQLVETFPNLSGAQKKAQALAFLGTVWSGLQNPQIAKIKEIQGLPFEAVAPLIGMLIDSAVALFNAVGVFTKKS